MDGSLNGETWRFIVRNIRIGVVEDDPASCQLVLDYLNRYQSETGEQFTVSVFDDGARIVEKYSPVYDILLLDIEMKEMDGMAAARRILQVRGQGPLPMKLDTFKLRCRLALRRPR